MPPSDRDLLENGNGGWQYYGTCGSLSWQIKRPDGSKYLVDTEKSGLQGLRVGLTWSIPWVGSVSGCDGKENQITVRTFNNEAGIAFYSLLIQIFSVKSLEILLVKYILYNCRLTMPGTGWMLDRRISTTSSTTIMRVNCGPTKTTPGRKSPTTTEWGWSRTKTNSFVGYITLHSQVKGD